MRSFGRIASIVSLAAASALAFVMTMGNPSAASATEIVQPPATPAPAADAPLAITGKLDIAYNTRTQPLNDDDDLRKGVKDAYTLNVTVGNTMFYQGKIEHLPTIFSKRLGREIQAAQLDYDIRLLMRDPNKPQDAPVPLGGLIGTVPVDKRGAYKFDDGTLRIAINARGAARGFESKFRGTAIGKPPKNTSTLASAKKQTLSITKMVKGKKRKIAVTDYDVMEFPGTVLPAGPVQAYPETTVKGKMVYDYERGAWYFNGLTLSYQGKNNQLVTDRLTGHILWIEDPERSSNGKGKYVFDVRLNEPDSSGSEAEAFAAADDESSFFEVDPTLVCVTGTMEYVDEMRQDPNASPDASPEDRIIVTASTVTINITSNGLTRQQITAFWKVLLGAIVPLNNE